MRDFMWYFLRKAHSTEQTPFTRVSPYGTRLTAESIEAMRLKCLAQGHNALMLPGFKPSITVSTNRRLTDMTNIIRTVFNIFCPLKLASESDKHLLT